MNNYFAKIKHHPVLPWRYFDVRRQKVVIRLISTTDVVNIELFYNDPFDYVQRGAEWFWRYETTPLYKQFSGGSALMWRVEIDVPTRRRLKYGFRVFFDGGETGWFSEWGLEPFSDATVNMPHNHFFYPFIHDADTPKQPAWVEETVWYQIFPDRFYRSGVGVPQNADWEKDEPTHRNFFGGDLEGIRRRLAYLKNLGVNGIYLTPIFKSPSNHKYDTEDYFSVDERFGGTETLKALTASAHELGIRVMLDAVFNHIGRTHPFWRDVLERQEKSPYKDFFHIHSFPVKERYEEPRSVNYDCFAFVPYMPKWNTENPQARKYLLDAALYWIKECGIDAWRLDVANEVSFDFWREFSALTHGAKSDFYVVGEIWDDASAWVNGGFFDAVMNYPLGRAVSEFFLQKKTDAQAALAFTDRLFLALSRYDDSRNSIAFNLLDSHDTERALTVAGGDKQALRNAFTVLFLLPGSPCVYYGTEVGMSGGRDPQCRAPMVWDEARRDKSLFAFFQRLIRFRLANIGLIKNCALSFAEENGVSYWQLTWQLPRRLPPFSPSEKGLTVVYTKGGAAFLEDLERRFGRLAFSALDGELEELPPYSVAVFG